MCLYNIFEHRIPSANYVLHIIKGEGSVPWGLLQVLDEFCVIEIFKVTVCKGFVLLPFVRGTMFNCTNALPKLVGDLKCKCSDIGCL